MTDTKTTLEAACKPLLEDLEGLSQWRWDERFEAILCEYAADQQDKVLSLLSIHFPIQWDAKSIKSAPSTLKIQSGPFAELRKGQLLFTVHEQHQQKLIAAVWPWGNGAKISLRILLPKEDAEPSPGWAQRLMKIFTG